MALSTGSKVFLIILVVVFSAIGGGLYYVNDQINGVPGEGDPVTIEVPASATASSIGELLVEQGVVKNALAFRLIAKSRDLDRGLQAGSYELETGMSIDDAISVLLQGPAKPDQLRFRVEEGLPVVTILERLDAQFEQFSAADFRAVLNARREAGQNGDGLLRLPEWLPDLNSFGPEVREPYEGILFPNTYDVFEDATPLDILQKMVDLLDDTVASIPEEQKAAAEARGLSTYDILTIASLIERETRVDAERAKVSGVIANRLANEQILQIDATVLYARGEHTQRVLTSDTEIDDPYNTYKYAGLPPTPISNMGIASIRAAFSPEEHDLLYYVVAPECDGTHRFATSLDEHNRNVAAFREAGRCQ